jgi:hypothetical protein
MNKNTDKKIADLNERKLILEILIRLIRIDRQAVVDLVEDAKQQAPVLLDPARQNDWLAKLRRDKVNQLAAIIQSRQRTDAARRVRQADVAAARNILNLPTANPFRLVKPTPINKLPVIKP